ncbi:MAG TPA: hypothetical protein VL461_11525 [Dictyobacter sp.]|jgi:hypothetical protein|nr:hypothetical protein [Dictyobacter sp.]
MQQDQLTEKDKAVLLEAARNQVALDLPDMRIVGAEISRVMPDYCYVEMFLRRADGEKDVAFYRVEYDSLEATMLEI